ncbi:MAG TPA: CehA/McbA family metallohydrolase [Bryobacterales bacterium]|nr:CehA/McbA family metallohydrolase [Bryobacterales bacterium]
MRLIRLVLFVWSCVAAAQSPALLTLEVFVTSGGKPTAARLYITGEGGRSHLAPGAVTYSRRGEEHSVIDQSVRVALPPGKYRVRAEKGLEYRVAEKTLMLETGDPARVDLDVPRFFDMHQFGWYSGDLHIHRRPEEMALLLRAEDLNIGPTITRHLGNPKSDLAPFPPTELLPVDDTHFAGIQNQEVERLGKGHGAVVLLNLPEPIAPEMTPLYPMDADFCRQARARKAFVDAEKPIWKNVPIEAAFGLIDAIGVVNNHFHPHDVWLDAEKYGSMERDKPAYKTVAGFAQWMMDLYYSFLNCGFRIPVSAGSASGVMPSWPGYERVYVHLSGPLSYDQWFADLRAGRSVATNGPLLIVALDGQPPGAEVAWDGPTSATIAIEAHSQERLDRIEIVYNGDVIRTFSGGGNAVFQTALNLTIPEPGWLAVRCFEPAGETIRYAHSSPFYFTRNGKLPVKKPAAQRWAEFAHRLAATANAGEYPSREAYEKAVATFREAEQIYRKLAE